MKLLDNESIDKLNQKITEYLADKHWADLTRSEIDLIEDPKKKKEYKEKSESCFKWVISPLYSGIKRSSGFRFSNPDNLLTCRNMIKDLMDYYYNLGYTRDEIIDIASENDINKKY